jgi:hypothetical protein
VIRLSVLWSVALSKHATYYGLRSGSLCYGVWHSPNMLPTMVCDQALRAMECGTLQTCYLLWSVIRLSVLWSVALSKHATYYGLRSGSLCYGVWHSPNMLPTMVCDQALCAMECGTLQNMLPTMVCDQALCAMECGWLSKHATYYGRVFTVTCQKNLGSVGRDFFCLISAEPEIVVPGSGIRYFIFEIFGKMTNYAVFLPSLLSISTKS